MHLRVTVVAFAMLCTCSPAVTVPSTPSAPSELRAEEVAGGAHLTWKDNSTNEDEFEVWRQAGGAEAMKIATVLFDGRQFHDASIAAGVAYTYRVRATNAVGESAYSNDVTFMISGAGGSGGGSGTGGGSGGAGGSGTGGGTGTGGGSTGGSGGSNTGSPTCTVTAPPNGTSVPYDQAVTFVATASDPQDGPLTGSSVVWRTNLSTSSLGSGLSVMTVLPMPGTHTVTCTATDSNGNTGVGTVAITATSPVALLNHPGDGEVRAAANPIPFIGNGKDFEDGMLPDAGLVWTSSIDGMIGTGRSFNRTLSAGTNVVTLRVTDSNGNTASRSITLTITP